MKLIERIHPPCNCKDCLEIEKKASKWDELRILNEPKDIRRMVASYHKDTNCYQNQKLRELIEKKIKKDENAITFNVPTDTRYKPSLAKLELSASPLETITSILKKLLKDSKK